MQNFLDKQWEEALLDLENLVSSIGMDLWIRKLRPIDIDGDEVVFVSTNPMSMSNVIGYYNEPMTKALQEHFKTSKFRVIQENEKEGYIKEHHLLEKSEEKHEAPPKAVTNEEEPTNPFNPRYTFDNFVVGTTNQIIYAATRAVAENPGKRFNPLFIYGGVGLGKTHLLHAIGNFLWSVKKPGERIVYVSSETFLNDFVEIMKHGKENGTIEFRKKYRRADVLLVDDIQFIHDKKKVQEEFFNTFNDLYQAGKQIIIAADKAPKEIFGLEERLASRFSCGLVQDIQKPDFETRLMIIRKKIQLENQNFDESVLPKLAERLETSNIREIEGVLNKLDLYAKLHGKFLVDEEVVNEVLSDPDIIKPPDALEMQEKIIDAICIKFNIKREDLFSKKRTKEIAESRQYAMYLMWKHLNIPLTAISKLFNRDHTTAMHSRDKVVEMIKADGSIKKLVEELEDLISR